MKAAYGVVSNVKSVPSQGVSRIEIEVPIECHVEATKMLFQQKVLVTLAPAGLPSRYGIVSPNADSGGQEGAGDDDGAEAGRESKRAGWKSLGPLCRSAVRLCEDPDFQRWVAVRRNWTPDQVTESAASTYIKEYCSVGTRKDLDTSEKGRRFFQEMMAQYRRWMTEQRMQRVPS